MTGKPTARSGAPEADTEPERGCLSPIQSGVTDIRRAERRLSSAIDAIDDSFSLYDADDRLVFCNKAYGVEHQPIEGRIAVGMTYSEIEELAWDAGIVVAPGIDRTTWLHTRLSRHRRADGAFAELNRGDRVLMEAEYRTGQGETVRVATAIGRLHRTKASLEQLPADGQRLGEDELVRRCSWLQAAMNVVTDGLALVAGDTGTVIWNRSFLDLVRPSLGLDEGAAGGLLNATMADLLSLLALPRDDIDALLSGSGETREWVLLDGRTFRIRVLGAGEGCSLLLISNVAERRRTEAERLALLEKLFYQEKSNSVGAIAATAAHDFNNLLTIILGFASLGQSQMNLLETLPARMLTRDPEANRVVGHVMNAAGSVAQSFGKIIDSAMRGRAIVQSLTTFAKPLPVETASNDLIETIEMAARLIRSSLPASVSLSLSPPGPGVRLTVQHDRGAIEQMLLNLAINGAHAIGEHAGSISIRVYLQRADGGRAGSLMRNPDVSLSGLSLVSEDGSWLNLWRGVLEAGDYARIDVVDTGPGMDMGTLKRIFDPFFTTKAQGQGTGLGLASVSRIVEAHGGAIHVRTGPGGPTTFSMLLPLSQAAMPAAERPPAAQAAAAGSGPGPHGEAGRGTIMVIDDEAYVAELSGLSLQRAGYRVEIYSDPAAALKRLRDEPAAFDLVVTDQIMPGMTGLELAGHLSGMSAGIQVLLCTGYSGNEIEETKRPDGIAGVLKKPFLPKDLIGKVGAILGRAR